MKCFECKKEIKDSDEAQHISDGDFVHLECIKLFESNKKEFFENIDNDVYFNNWLNKE